MANLNTALGFKITNPAPADAKYLVENATALQAIITEGNAYVGMQCYNQADNKLYIVYQDGEVLKYKELLGSTASDITDLKSDVTTLKGDKTTEGSVAKSIADTVGTLSVAENADATVANAIAKAVSDTETYADGKVSAEETRAKAAEKANADAITVLNGDDTTTGSVAKSVKDLKESLDATVRGQLTDADAIDDTTHKVGIKIVEEDGKLTSVTVVENDIASASDLSDLDELVGDLPTGATATNVVGYAKEVADAAQKEADDRLTVVETALADGGDTAKAIKANTDAIAKLNGADTAEGSVAKAVKDAIDTEVTNRNTAISTAIDNLAGSASQTASADNGQLALSVTTENGEVTAISGSITANTYAAYGYEAKVDTLIGSDSSKSVRTIANEELTAQLVPSTAKESLDTLKEIADWIQAHPDDASAMNTAITNLQGLVGESALGTDEKTVVTRVGDLETKVGSSSVSDQIDAKINDLDADFTGDSSATSTHITTTLKEENGKVTAFTVSESNIANADDLATLTTYVGTATVPADAEKGTAEVQATGLTAQVEALEKAVGEGGSVASQIQTEIEKLDADILSSELGSGTSAVFADGATTTDAVEATVKVRAEVKEVDGKITEVAVTTADVASAVKLAQEIQERKNAIAALDADVKSADNADASAGKGTNVNVEVVETDGKITAVKVTESDIASASTLSSLSDRVGLTDASGLSSRIKANEDAITTLNGDSSTTGSVAKAVADEASRIDAVIGTGYSSTSTVATGIANAKQAGDDAKISTVSFASGTALAGSFASNTLTLTDVAQASVLSTEATNIDNLQALIGESALSTGESTVVTRLGVLEGADTVEGSVAKAKKDAVASAKEYTDGLVGTVPASVGTTTTSTVVAYVDAKVAVASASASQVATDLATETTNRTDADQAINDKIGGDYSSTNTVASAIADAKKAGTDAATAVSTLESGTVATNTSAISDIKTFIGFAGGVNVATQIANAVASAGHLKRLVVENLPTADIDEDTIYMVTWTDKSTEQADDNNVYAEYMYINNAWERIGSTKVDLSAYQKSADLVAVTDTEITNLFNGKNADGTEITA